MTDMTRITSEEGCLGGEEFWDILNRDQRTMLTIDRREVVQCRHRPCECGVRYDRTNSEIRPCKECDSKTHLNKSFRSHKKYWMRWLNGRNITERLGDALIVGICLLTLVRTPGVMSAPSRHGSRSGDDQDERDDTPKWMYPCGRHHEQELENEFDLVTSRESDAEILNHIILQAQIALSHAESFKKEYVQKTFDLPFEKHHNIWIDNRYDWLPSTDHEIPKKLGKKVRETHLESRGFDDFLRNIYEYLQRFAVGIEQVVWDQEKSNGEFKQHFNSTETHLKKVLCEIRTAMIERSVTPNENVERSIMADQYRNMDPASYRNLRDWLIFRDYMNGLEYVIEVFKFIQQNLPS